MSTGKVVEKFFNLTDAAAAINLTKQDLLKVCLNVNKVSNGYVWSYSFILLSDLKDKGKKQYNSLV
jgi:hypothetical protein